MARHSLDFWLTSEDLPDPNNRVTLDAEGNVVLTYAPNNLKAHQRLRRTLEKYVKGQRSCSVHGASCHQGLFGRSLFVGEQIPLAGVAHQNGTIRFGTDPATSALDLDCQLHDLNNLYVVDSSFFCSSTAVNPTLTIIANAIRVADRLKEALGATPPTAETVGVAPAGWAGSP